MMLILTDDRNLWLFDSPKTPPNWIEPIDIENEEYRFADHTGQRFLGVMMEPVGVFKSGSFELRADGEPDLKHALLLVDEAVSMQPNELFATLASLRQHLTSE